MKRRAEKISEGLLEIDEPVVQRLLPADVALSDRLTDEEAANMFEFVRGL